MIELRQTKGRADRISGIQNAVEYIMYHMTNDTDYEKVAAQALYQL